VAESLLAGRDRLPLKNMSDLSNDYFPKTTFSKAKASACLAETLSM
jgi:hypothetical protein